jgi:preprotein translocase subunit SecE
VSESTAPLPAPRERDTARRGNPIARLVTYVRQVVAELRKVVWPTRNELITYTSVVLVFVVIMTSLVAGFDFVFAKGVLAVFGK